MSSPFERTRCISRNRRAAGVREHPVVTEQPSTRIIQVKNGRWAASCAPLRSACFPVKLCFEPELAVAIIVRFRSTACNHGPVLRGCMIMQSTTWPAMIEVIRRRQSTACVSIDQDTNWEREFDHCPNDEYRTDKRNAPDDRAVASKVSIRKRPIHRFGPSDCSSHSWG
jgi:hypothetical protein